MFGFTEAEVASFGLTWGLVFLMGLMLFIIWDLARRSNAGRLGTFVLFFVLALGIFGFIVKNIIKWLMDI